MSGKGSFYTSTDFWVILALAVLVILVAAWTLLTGAHPMNSPEGLGW